MMTYDENDARIWVFCTVHVLSNWDACLFGHPALRGIALRSQSNSGAFDTRGRGLGCSVWDAR